MEAMILAAGEGARLRPLTDRIPKALVPVRGRPLIAHVLDRLAAAGTTHVIVNTCRHAEAIAGFLRGHTPRGVRLSLHDEPDGPYDTGGGLLAAASLFERGGPFLLHAVDVLSRIPLEELLARHRATRADGDARVVATLAVQDRAARRRLLFDAEGLVGWEERGSDGAVRDALEGREPAGPVARWGFAGVHVVEPAILDLPHPPGRFPMVAWYLELVRRGYRVAPADVTAYPWLDVGTPERLAEADAGDW
jgi:NDP-sugar pyrophosphorylase family protein